MKKILNLFIVLSTSLIFNNDKPSIVPLSDQMINFINENDLTWKAGKNKFNDWSLDSVKKLLGVSNYNLGKASGLDRKVHNIFFTIPDKFDSRENWPKCKTIQEIRDQGNCGSCWSISAVASISDRICIFSNGLKNPRISAQNLLSCCKTQCGFGCEGGFPDEAWKWYVEEGIVTGGNYKSNEGCQPYSIPDCGMRNKTDPICHREAKTPRCSRKCQRSYNISYNLDKYFGEKAYSIDNNEEQIQAEIMLNGPVQATYMVYSDFMNYESGVYIHSAGSMLGGHAVKIIGWGVEDSIKYWLVANSWNTDWGMNGFFKILRGSDECGIEAGVLAGIPSAEFQ